MEETKAPYTIYAEMTPNPNTMKFVSNRWLILNDKSYEVLADQRMGGPSPLAEKLFNFPFINGVFISANFITITKTEVVEWDDIMIELRNFIAEYLNTEGMQIIHPEFENVEAPSQKEVEKEDGTKEIVEHSDFDKKIIEILDEYIKPAVESDGGAIEFDSYVDGVVKVVLKGACSGCPSSTATLKGGIESLLKSMLPEVQEVEAING